MLYGNTQYKHEYNVLQMRTDFFLKKMLFNCYNAQKEMFEFTMHIMISSYLFIFPILYTWIIFYKMAIQVKMMFIQFVSKSVFNLLLHFFFILKQTNKRKHMQYVLDNHIIYWSFCQDI